MKSTGPRRSLSTKAPTIQPSVKIKPVVLEEKNNAIDPKKPAIVNKITRFDGITPSSANPANRALITMPL